MTKRQVLAGFFIKKKHMCVRVCGGGEEGPVTSKLSEIPGGSNICYPGGEGMSTFFSNGVESNC